MAAVTTGLDADRQVALAYVPEAARAAVAALWRLDVTLGAVVAGGREPMIGRIKLAWWREALAKLDREPPPAEPLLQSLAADLLPWGVAGAELAAMEAAWMALTGEEPLTAEEIDGYASARGGTLFRLTARLLGGGGEAGLEQAGEEWALADLARRSNRRDAEAALAAAAGRPASIRRWPKRLRPLGMLAVLAQRDIGRGLERLEPPGAPPRVARMLRHRLTGK